MSPLKLSLRCTGYVAYKHLLLSSQFVFPAMWLLTYFSVSLCVTTTIIHAVIWGARTPGGTQRHLREYAKTFWGAYKIEKRVFFHDKHWIARHKFRFSQNRPGHKDFRFESSILFLSLSQIFFFALFVCSFNNFYNYLIYYLELHLFNLF
jgi:hypothetical protein